MDTNAHQGKHSAALTRKRCACRRSGCVPDVLAVFPVAEDVVEACVFIHRQRQNLCLPTDFADRALAALLLRSGYGVVRSALAGTSPGCASGNISRYTLQP